MVTRLFEARVLAAVAAVSFSVAMGSSTVARARSTQSEAPAVSEVLVRASPGPALWRITKSASELVILGVVSPTPENGIWNDRPFVQAVQGARVLMLSPGSTPGFAWADYFPESERFRLGQPFGRTLAKEMSSDAEARFEQMAVAIRQSPKRYSSYRPGPAGMILLEDSWTARGLTESMVDDTAIGVAKAARVRVVKVDEGGALPLIDAMPSMSEAQHADCIRDAMNQFDWEGSNVSPSFQAWADGDLNALRKLYKPVSLCMESIPGGAERRARARMTWLKALSQALATPGRAVAVMDVADLLEPSDLLAALRADGATVTEPHGKPNPRSGITSTAASAIVEPTTLMEVAKSAPVNLITTLSERPTKIYFRTNVGANRGEMVDLAGNQITCVSEAPVGSIIPLKICHTTEQWADIRKEREIAVREFYKNKHQNQTSVRSTGAPE